MKIVLKLLSVSLIIVVTDCLAVIKHPATVKGSTTYVLKTIAIPQSPYIIGLGVGKIAANTSKPWTINTAPELAYLLAGQVSIYTKSHGKFIAIAGDSYKPPVNELHRTQAGPNGMTYVVVFGQNKNIAITKGRKKPSLNNINLTTITRQAKKLAALKNIKNMGLATTLN